GDLRTDLRQLDEDDVAQLLLREVRDPDPDAIALPLGPLVLARVLEIARNVSHGSSYLPSEPLRRAPGLDGRRINTSFSSLPSEPLRRAPGLDGRRINTSVTFSLGRDETVSSRRARASPGRGSRHRSRYRSRLARAAHTRARWSVP